MSDKVDPKFALEALKAQDPDRYNRLVAEQLKYAFTPHSDSQKEILDDESRFVVVSAGRRYGKTKVAARKMIRHAIRNPGTVDWWVGNVYKNTRRGYREVVRQLPPKFLAKPPSPPTANDLIIELKNGSRLEFYSGTNPDAMAGEGVGFVVVDEAALQAEVVWSQIIRPTLMDHGGKALLISTPRGRNWFWKLYRRGEDPQYPAYSSYRRTTADNPLIPKEEIDEARETLPEVLYKQEILAEFIAGTASIFKVPDEAVIPAPQGFLPGEQIILGVDLAKHEDFTVIHGERASDGVPVHHERFNSLRWSEQRERIHATVEMLEAQGATVTIGVDATGVGDVIFDDLDEAGLDVIPIKFTNDWKNKAVKLLASQLEQAQTFILEDQLPEFESYEYAITPAGRITYSAPEGGHDDEVSAKLLAHWVRVHESLHDGIRGMSVGAEFRSAAEEAETLAEEEAPVVVPGPRSPQELLDDPNVWS